jgi:L-cysteine S-thiosulfotransferase
MRAAVIALFVLVVHIPASFAGDTRKSGFDFMSPATQALQANDSENPAMLWVKSGEALFNAPAGEAKKSCADCHREKALSLKGAAAVFPRYELSMGRPVNLGQRINFCRKNKQRAAPWATESRELLGVEAFVALQSRGEEIAPWRDKRMSAHFVRGEKHFKTRIGQLDLSCADCHDKNAGKKLAGNPIPQAHPTAYPLYRLEWQSLGSLQRRIRNCMSGIRAEPFAVDSLEMVELETYLMSRAAGMKIESPGVRP